VSDPDPTDGGPVGTVGEESRLLVEAIVAGLETGPRDEPAEDTPTPTSGEDRPAESATGRGDAEDCSDSAHRSPLRTLLSRVDPTVLHSAADAAELLARGLRDVAEGLGRPGQAPSRHRGDTRPGSRTPRKDPPPCP